MSIICVLSFHPLLLTRASQPDLLTRSFVTLRSSLTSADVFRRITSQRSRPCVPARSLPAVRRISYMLFSEDGEPLTVDLRRPPTEASLASRHALFEVRLLNPRSSGGDRLRWGVFSLTPLCSLMPDRRQCFCRFGAAPPPRSGHCVLA